MSDTFFRPVSGFDLPRFAGVATFMRLPHVALTDERIDEVDIGLIGVPWDGGTTNRSGPRHGPRQLRDMSTMIRAQNGATGVRPFELVNCADLGDVSPNPADLVDSMDRVSAFYDTVKSAGIVPLTAGGDHACKITSTLDNFTDMPIVGPLLGDAAPVTARLQPVVRAQSPKSTIVLPDNSLFEDAGATHWARADVKLVDTLTRQQDLLFTPKGERVLEWDLVLGDHTIGKGGIGYHYNKPYGDSVQIKSKQVITANKATNLYLPIKRANEVSS